MTPEIKIQADNNGFVYVTETTRKGLDDKAPPSIKIDGTLGAPHQFLIGKKSLFEDDVIHLQIFKDKGKLVLLLGDSDPYSTHTITGSLKKDSVLELFKINTDYRYTVNEFVKFIKTMRYYFSDAEEHKKLVESLQKWNVKVETEIKNHNDNRGNSLLMLEKKVGEMGLIQNFNLTIPIYQGYEKQKFTVEIGLDPKNTSVDLFLISDELFEREISFREQLIAAEVSRFEEYSFSKVIVS